MCHISERENVVLVKIDTKKGGKMGLQVNADQVFDFEKRTKIGQNEFTAVSHL